MTTAFTFSVGLVPSQQELVDLYTSVGWSAYTDHPEDLVPMCTGSLYLAVAREETTGRLAGLVRVVGDGVSISYIQDLLINPDFQKSGLGSRLLDMALAAVGGVRQVYITTDTHPSNQHVIDLYRGRGFNPVEGYGCVTLAKFTFDEVKGVNATP
ncbi:GNAT family N-acetyltransferase [Rothia nasimurium]|uniref:GNAT family N-acetyltransferase n=1 Tax=Rothia nasimurium TaxID=85336 RepID=UPI001F370F2F|nr:GNAT family N-acetyltransferase [Rothia nasimurium]